MARDRQKSSRTVKELRKVVAGWRKAGERVALVPTMGALHDGHLAAGAPGPEHAEPRPSPRSSSIRRSSRRTRISPTIRATRPAISPSSPASACDLVWAPGAGEMYPDGFATRIVPAGAAQGLESDFRPHFFGGVATVCCKLFTQVAPDIAVFGEKDYQQLQVIRQMVRDLDLPLEIVGVPTVREADGLAMSSRNAYLDASQRRIAPAIHRAISTLAGEVAALGAKATPARIGKLVGAARAGDRWPPASTRSTMSRCAMRRRSVPPSRANGRPLRVLAAAWLGKTRLIDNVPVAR